MPTVGQREEEKIGSYIIDEVITFQKKITSSHCLRHRIVLTKTDDFNQKQNHKT